MRVAGQNGGQRKKLLSVGFEIVANTPSQLTAYVKADIIRMRKLIKDAGIKSE